MRNVVRSGLALVLLVGVMVVPPVLAQDEAPTVEVSSNPLAFTPDDLTVSIGDTVTFTVTSGAHTVTSDGCEADDCYTNGTGEALDSGTLSTGDTFTFTFDEPGSFDYFCGIHSSADGTAQNGTITVAEEAQTEEPTDEPTDAPTEVPTDAPSGDDPVANALAWSARLPADAAPNALLGTTSSFADSLASGALQNDGSPLLLTPTDSLDERVETELARLGTESITILGGTAAISETVEARLRDDLGLTVTRYAGASRIGTAIEAARGAAPDATTAIIARAFGEGSAGFADSLGGGALAAVFGWPVLLTQTEVLTGDVADYLQSSPIQTVYVLGGTAAVSEETAEAIRALGIEVNRLAGAGRAATAAAIFDRMAEGGGFAAQDGFAAEDGFAGAGATTIVIAEGQDELAWSSGFPAALHATRGLLLTFDDVVPGETMNAVFGAGFGVVCGPLVPNSACDVPRAATTVTASFPDHYAVMDADQGPEPNGSMSSGLFSLYLPTLPETVCYMADVATLSGPVVAAHVHQGGFGEAPADNIVVGLPMVSVPGPGDRYLGCASAASGFIDAIVGDPMGHYVNLHTEANPTGEVRGQLFAADGTAHSFLLNGEHEVDGEGNDNQGDPDGFGGGAVFLTGVPGEVCYVVGFEGIGLPLSGAHIHEAPAGANGGVAHPLVIGPGDAEGFAHCDRGVDQVLLDRIAADPTGFYVNLHNADYPNGAIRGQLVSAGP